uniref:VP41 n=1 Tax=Grass carp reovirus TaxID=128987 RepID=M1S2Z6_GCRV|nr:VP41 [Grass carp reovirus]
MYLELFIAVMWHFMLAFCAYVWYIHGPTLRRLYQRLTATTANAICQTDSTYVCTATVSTMTDDLTNASSSASTSSTASSATTSFVALPRLSLDDLKTHSKFRWLWFSNNPLTIDLSTDELTTPFNSPQLHDVLFMPQYTLAAYPYMHRSLHLALYFRFGYDMRYLLREHPGIPPLRVTCPSTRVLFMDKQRNKLEEPVCSICRLWIVDGPQLPIGNCGRKYKVHEIFNAFSLEPHHIVNAFDVIPIVSLLKCLQLDVSMLAGLSLTALTQLSELSRDPDVTSAGFLAAIQFDGHTSTVDCRGDRLYPHPMLLILFALFCYRRRSRVYFRECYLRDHRRLTSSLPDMVPYSRTPGKAKAKSP